MGCKKSKESFFNLKKKKTSSASHSKSTSIKKLTRGDLVRGRSLAREALASIGHYSVNVARQVLYWDYMEKARKSTKGSQALSYKNIADMMMDDRF